MHLKNVGGHRMDDRLTVSRLALLRETEIVSLYIYQFIHHMNVTHLHYYSMPSRVVKLHLRIHEKNVISQTVIPTRCFPSFVAGEPSDSVLRDLIPTSIDRSHIFALISRRKALFYKHAGRQPSQ